MTAPTIPRSPAWVPFAIMALTQIAIPLTSDDATIEWLSSLVVVTFFATSLTLVVGRWTPRAAASAAAFVVVATTIAEKVGTSTGFPFGEYDYTGALRPSIGGVPVIVPLAWFAMGVPALVVGRRIVPRPATGSIGSAVGPTRARRAATVVVGALALTAWDLFLDPQMVDAGYWEWAVDGRYHGIPWSNYLGWIGLGIVVLAVLDRILPEEPATAGPEPLGLVSLYTWWAVMNTIGFIVFFGEPDVGIVGGLAMGTMTALAWRGRMPVRPTVSA